MIEEMKQWLVDCGHCTN